MKLDTKTKKNAGVSLFIMTLVLGGAAYYYFFIHSQVKITPIIEAPIVKTSTGQIQSGSTISPIQLLAKKESIITKDIAMDPNTNLADTIEKTNWKTLAEINNYTANNENQSIEADTVESKEIILNIISPRYFREGDRTEIDISLTNNSSGEKTFTINFISEEIQVNKPSKDIIIGAGKTEITTFWTSGGIQKDVDLSYIIEATNIENPELNQKIESTLKYSDFTNRKTVYAQGGHVELQEVENLRIDVPENTDIEKSSVKISFSNHVGEGLKNTIPDSNIEDYSNIEAIFSKIIPYSILGDSKDIFSPEVESEQIESIINVGVEKILSLQGENGGFRFWNNDSPKEISPLITAYSLRKLIELQNNGVKIPQGNIDAAIKYLEENFDKITQPLEISETFFALTQSGKGVNAYNSLIKENTTSSFDRHSLIMVTYGLINLDATFYKNDITENIETINIMMANPETFEIWSKESDLALFTSILLDAGMEKAIIEKNIQELYGYDWSEYNSSAIERSNTFSSFTKYNKKYGSNSSSYFAFSIGTIHNRDKRFTLGGQEERTVERLFKLKDIVQYKENHMELTSFVLSGGPIFTRLELDTVSADISKIKAYNNNIEVSRSVFKINDTTKIETCLIKREAESCENLLSLIDDNSFQKGVSYKIIDTIVLGKNKKNSYIKLQEAIPASFSITHIQTNMWNNIEVSDDLIIAETSNVEGETLTFKYIITPDFRGDFRYPPSTVFMNYKRDIHAHTQYQTINVK